MNRLILTTALLLAFVVTTMAVPFDSLIVECNVTDVESEQPVSAQIRYELLPYGSKIGIRHGSSCKFRIEQNEEYTVRVSADGYLPASITIAYAQYAGAAHITEEIKLTPLEGGEVIRLESLTFEVASSVINEEAYDELDKLVELLSNNPEIRIRLEGHTDYIGDPRLNMKLSEDRVKATREYLVTKGIDKSRIEIEAFGGTKPLSRENSTKAHALNRRVEVRILEN